MQRGGGNFRGSSRGGRGGRGGFGNRPQTPLGPPQRISGRPKEKRNFICPVEAGELKHTCEGELICKFTHIDPSLVPYFNGRIFLENKTEIGKIDEIFGPLTDMVGIDQSVSLNYLLITVCLY